MQAKQESFRALLLIRRRHTLPLLRRIRIQQDDALNLSTRSLRQSCHLHRFEYTTSTGVKVRFIVIQKSGSSFGVGLDACEICRPSRSMPWL